MRSGIEKSIRGLASGNRRRLIGDDDRRDRRSCAPRYRRRASGGSRVSRFGEHLGQRADELADLADDFGHGAG